MGFPGCFRRPSPSDICPKLDYWEKGVEGKRKVLNLQENDNKRAVDNRMKLIMVFMLKIQLLSGNASVGISILVCLALVIAVAVFARGYMAVSSTKDTMKKGGLKGLYPNIIKYIMQNYPNAVVVTDTPVLMKIESEDLRNDVKRQFTLRLNPDSKDVKVTGRLISGNEKWAWIPPTEMVWNIETKYGPTYSESQVIKKMETDMVFKAE